MKFRDHQAVMPALNAEAKKQENIYQESCRDAALSNLKFAALTRSYQARIDHLVVAKQFIERAISSAERCMK